MYIRKNCPTCGCWAVFEFSIFCHRASETCMHCGYSMKNLAWDREARKLFEDNTKFFEELSEKYPLLKDLKEPGDHVKIEDPD